MQTQDAIPRADRERCGCSSCLRVLRGDPPDVVQPIEEPLTTEKIHGGLEDAEVCWAFFHAANLIPWPEDQG